MGKKYEGKQRVEPVLHTNPSTGKKVLWGHRVGSNKSVTQLDSETLTGIGNGLMHLGSDKPEKFASPYESSLYVGGEERFHLPYDTRQVYRRRITQEQLGEAVRHGIPDSEIRAAILLAGKKELTAADIEQYLHISYSVEPEHIAEYVKRGYTLDEAETLAKLGGEPRELTPEEKKIWKDKWEAWEKKNRTVRFPDANFVSGKYEVPIDEAMFAVMDFETTGFTQDANNRVIEIGIVVVDSKGNILKRLDTLVRCDEAVHLEGADDVHKIDLETLKNAPTFAEVYPQVAEMLNGSIIVAQNKAFEQHHLSGEIARITEGEFSFPSICTVDLAKRFVGDATPNHKLGTMCEHFGVALGDRAHMAIADAEATAQMLIGYLDHIKAQGRTKLYFNEQPVALPQVERKNSTKVKLLQR